MGARQGHAARFLDVYLENPLGLFSLNPSTLAPLDGMVAGLVAATIYGQRKKLPLWPTLDALAQTPLTHPSRWEGNRLDARRAEFDIAPDRC